MICKFKDPFTMKMENNFADSLLFGLYDIFNHLIYTPPNMISKDLLRITLMKIIDCS